LWEERARYLAHPDQARTIGQNLGDGAAVRHFAAATEHEGLATALTTRPDAPVELAIRERVLSADERQAAETLVREAARGHPVVALPGFDLRRLAATPADDVADLLRDEIDRRLAEVDQVREALRADPERVLDLPELLGATEGRLGVAPSSLAARIVDDHIRDRRAAAEDRRWTTGLLLTAASLLTLGSAVPAVVVAGTTTAINVHDFDAAVDDYVIDESAYRTGLTSAEPDPSAVVGAGIDFVLGLGEIVGAVRRPPVSVAGAPVRTAGPAALLTPPPAVTRTVFLDANVFHWVARGHDEVARALRALAADPHIRLITSTGVYLELSRNPARVVVDEVAALRAMVEKLGVEVVESGLLRRMPTYERYAGATDEFVTHGEPSLVGRPYAKQERETLEDLPHIAEADVLGAEFWTLDKLARENVSKLGVAPAPESRIALPDTPPRSSADNVLRLVPEVTPDDIARYRPGERIPPSQRAEEP
jgi:hypothetical protein